MPGERVWTAVRVRVPCKLLDAALLLFIGDQISVSNAPFSASNQRMHVTRRAEFSASHFCRVPGLSEAENRELFGEEANLNGHGHNFIVEVTLEGEPDPVTGMVIDPSGSRTFSRKK